MTYSEALEYLNSFINYEQVDSYNYKSSLKIDRMRRFAALLGDPQKYTSAIHIAGSKGKGSTASYTYSILKKAGYKTGLYTSPHLISFRERIRIDDEFISEDDLCRILEKIKGLIERFMNDDRPSFFEVYTALAYLYFKEKKVDFAVYEVGLGGRLDATNLIEPLVCAITPLSYEHTDKLGNTLEEIAFEKCGIIKNGSICVSAPQEKSALKVIEDVCRQRSSKLFVVGKDIFFEEVSSSYREEIFNISGVFNKYQMLCSNLIGSHQMINAAVAVGVIEALKVHGINIAADAVKKGIENAKWEGRLEVISEKPFVIIDGAQNRASARCLADAIKKLFKFNKLILVLGVSKDKDLNGILEELLPIADSLYLTRANVSARALDPARIKTAIEKIERNARNPTLTTSVKEAVNGALLKANKDDLIMITGSLFVAGEARECLKTT